jgi:NAD(P)-dependent dehydrogenase (short-subunit alcohol dehydrogenase family)
VTTDSTAEHSRAGTEPGDAAFYDSVTVITGAGSGIGRATALELARRGALVVATDIDLAEAEKTAGLIEREGHQCWARRLDVTSTDDYETTRDFCLSQWGRVNRIMNNVGLVAVGLPEYLPMSEWHRTIDVNLLGIVRSNEVFLPVLTAQGHGQLVNTASTSGLLPYSYDRLAYTATKAAVIALTQSLALYLRPQGIQVNCLCPAGVRTAITDHMVHYGPPRPLGVPSLPAVTAEEFATTVALGLAEDRFLICSVPEAYSEAAHWGADLQGYLDSAIERYGYRPGPS